MRKFVGSVITAAALAAGAIVGVAVPSAGAADSSPSDSSTSVVQQGPVQYPTGARTAARDWWL